MKPIDKKRWELLRMYVEEALSEAEEDSECQGWLISASQLLDEIENENRK